MLILTPVENGKDNAKPPWTRIEQITRVDVDGPIPVRWMNNNLVGRDQVHRLKRFFDLLELPKALLEPPTV